MQQGFTFPKNERLSSIKLIDKLFVEGKSLFVHPFRVLYLPVGVECDVPVQVVFSVPKRNFKQAVQRNLIRRRMREAYRLNKHSFCGAINMKGLHLSVVIIYVDKQIRDYKTIEKGMIRAMIKVSESV
jgi:ribonuclease P protein component